MSEPMLGGSPAPLMPPADPGPYLASGTTPTPTGPVPCATCGQPAAASPSAYAVGGATTLLGPVLAIGRLRASFPSLGHQREYAEVAAADPDAPITGSALKQVIEVAENRYLARQTCWIFTVQANDVFSVVPGTDADLDELVDLLSGEDDGTVHALVGEPATAPVAQGCWLPGLPAITPVQVLSFSLDEFVSTLGDNYDASRDSSAGGGNPTRDDPRYRATVQDLFYRLTRRADSTGFADDDRARNFLALKDPAVYALTWDRANNGQNLIEISTRRSVRNGRRLVGVRLSYRHHQTHLIERFQCQVDTTDLFCFKAAGLTPTYD